MCLYLFIPCAVSSEPLLVYQIPRRTKGGIFLLTSDPTASPAAMVGGDGVCAYKPDNTENLNRSEQLWLLNAFGSLLFYLFKIVLSLSCCWKKTKRTNLMVTFFFCLEFRSRSLCLVGGDFEELWSHSGCDITLPGLPEWCLHEHYPHAKQEIEDLHW